LGTCIHFLLERLILEKEWLVDINIGLQRLEKGLFGEWFQLQSPQYMHYIRSYPKRHLIDNSCEAFINHLCINQLKKRWESLEFRVETQKKEHLKKYAKEDVDLAFTFAKKVYKELGTFIKAIVLFGSAARKKQNSKDVDILLVIDDLNIKLTKELVQTYRIIVEKIVADISPKLHIITLKFSSFWEYVRAGDPIAVNILRDGVALVDTGFFDPLQALLYQGRVRPSPESMWAYYAKAPATLQNAKWHVLQAVLDLYWAVIDAAHAALMKVGEVPPSPEFVSELLDRRMVKANLLDKKYVKTVDHFYRLSKAIAAHEVKEINGAEWDHLQREATEFVDVIQKFMRKS